MPLRLLVVDSETADQKAERRKTSGAASFQSYASTLRKLSPDATIATVCCVEGPNDVSFDLGEYDGVLFAGSPIQMHQDTAEARSAAAFMTGVFASGIPAFGSCAGLQIAATAAGGRCKPRDAGMQVGFARDIVATTPGRQHPLLDGRPQVWSAPAMHSCIVDQLPPGAIRLAESRSTPVEAAEIRSGNGVFWGVQYHPELDLAEIAASIRRQSDDVIEEGLAENEEALDAYARTLETLNDDPQRQDLAWQIGVNEQVTLPVRRQTELANFLRFLKT
ncbi:gamma-glutamyl-gamma-aminobutyrate hydrolase family protein [Rhizobium sp. DKSPLA3]|uniref:Gamma-glutamyl-gamma-aminobutyrate hydrolase family protein n=1 Tax=Rhizobium quercicola TaxID=2901226 RepID=A0A9X1NVW5_9HYPH|nr:gamma-glutamyl-gamma-aminobutyrate hydrolase family protein [Rhizobium quercicola]MCD7111443.1 gamma-glutamyl-gamma-aminobutyrate hydrolase family protein [Rhizobium quercicola]